MSTPKTFASSSYLDCLSKLNLRLNHGDSQCLSTSNRNKHLLTIEANYIARRYLLQPMLHLIDLNLCQDQPHLDAYQTQTLLLVDEVQSWPWSFIETNSSNLFNLQIVNIFQQDYIIAFSYLIHCYLAIDSHCQVTFTR